MMAQSGLPRSIGHGDNMKYRVRINGRTVRKFQYKQNAHKFMVNFFEVQQNHQKQFQYIDEAVDKSDLKEARELLQYIMEKK
jgi:hypothetical protein